MFKRIIISAFIAIISKICYSGPFESNKIGIYANQNDVLKKATSPEQLKITYSLVAFDPGATNYKKLINIIIDREATKQDFIPIDSWSIYKVSNTDKSIIYISCFERDQSDIILLYYVSKNLIQSFVYFVVEKE